MRVMTMMVAAALGLGLVACAQTDRSKASAAGDLALGPDGAKCGTSSSGPVYIDIDYAGNGTPVAVQDPCTVAPGTDITWRGPDGSLIPFEIVFAGASPAWHDERPSLMSIAVEKRYKVKIQASDKPGRYKYGIKANGKEIDPVIIIR